MNIGDRVGKLIILNKVAKIINNKSRLYFECLCDCGTIKLIRTDLISKSHFASCGCERINNRVKTILSKEDRLHNGINLIGEKYGDLTILELVNPTGHVKYKCSCSCGNIVTVRFDHLKNNETKSCGCKRKELLRESSKSEYGQSAFNDLYNGYKQGAKGRGIAFELNKEEFKKLTKSNCFYCGSIPSQVRKVKGNNGDYIYNGIDRIDSNFGYNINNCVACCTMCNYMKRSYTVEDFKNHIIKLYHNFAKN